MSSTSNRASQTDLMQCSSLVLLSTVAGVMCRRAPPPGACRFCQGDNRSQLPKWLQPHLKMYSQFGMAQRELNLFIKKAEEKVCGAWVMGGVGVGGGWG